MSDGKLLAAGVLAYRVVPNPHITDRFGGHVLHAFAEIKRDRLALVDLFETLTDRKGGPAEAIAYLRRLIESDEMPPLAPPEVCRCPNREFVGTAAGFAQGERGTCRKCGKEPG